MTPFVLDNNRSIHLAAITSLPANVGEGHVAVRSVQLVFFLLFVFCAKHPSKGIASRIRLLKFYFCARVDV